MYLVDNDKNLVDYASYVFDLCHPIGEIYIRYPGQPSPQDLYKRGTWDNISNVYAGLFFRAEGGNANPFEGGSQEDKIRNITGRTFSECYTSSLYKGVFRHGGTNEARGASAGGSTEVVNFDANADNNSGGNPMAGHADGPEIRPVNTTIQIWKRTS